MDDDKYQGEYVDVLPEQVKLVTDFIDSLKENDIESFWSMISNKDQARVYGIFKTLERHNHKELNQTFQGFIKQEIFEPWKQRYEHLFEDLGILTHLRFTENGEHIICTQNNVVVARYYIAPAEEIVYPFTLTVDVEMKKMDFKSVWKIRLYDDLEFENI